MGGGDDMSSSFNTSVRFGTKRPFRVTDNKYLSVNPNISEII